MNVGASEMVIFALVDTQTYLICKLGDGHYGIKVAPEIDTYHTEIGWH
jgi:hypothetical protein